MRVSENSHSETVWKIAEGLSRVVHRRLETADRAPSTPIGRLRDPYFGIHPAFPNSFSNKDSRKPPALLGPPAGRLSQPLRTSPSRDMFGLLAIRGGKRRKGRWVCRSSTEGACAEPFATRVRP